MFLIPSLLFILGAISGSFLLASVWRLRAEQLSSEKDYKNKDYTKLVKKNHLAKKTPLDDFSRCLHCGYRLKWYDLIPVVSWLSLGGKCRKCRHKIGWTELLAELSVGFVFSLSYLFWPFGFGVNPLEVVLFGVFIVWLLCLVVLFIYDFKWMELPSKVLYLAIAVSVVFAIGRALIYGFDNGAIWNYIFAIVILSGLYWLISTLSKERAVGSGDAYIGLTLALVLGDWKLAALALFLANAIGTILVVPSLVFNKKTLSSRLPLGPLLIIAGVISFFWGNSILTQLGIF